LICLGWVFRILGVEGGVVCFCGVLGGSGILVGDVLILGVFIWGFWVFG
jgi:hypothetical protein